MPPLLIADIARKAKVSPATVSRVINQPHLVAPDRLERVRSVMTESDYVPTPLHRRRGPKSRLATPKKIAVWFVGAKKNSSFNWFQDQLLQTQHSNDRQRLELSVLFTDTPDDLPRALAERQVDGVIIQGMEPSPACLTKLGDLPNVWFMTRRSQTYAGDFVEPDNDANGRMAANYLHQHGHKSLAVIAADSGYSAVGWRVKAFLEQAKELGLTVHSILGKTKPVNFLEVVPVHEESDALAKRFCQISPRPTGIYVPVDHFCGSLFRSLRLAGVKSERDFEAILGNYNPVIYHNLDHLPPALDINLPTLVRKVVDHLVWRIDNPKIIGRIGITVAPSLVVATSQNGQIIA
jgi:LacI family transcriptional regulator